MSAARTLGAFSPGFTNGFLIGRGYWVGAYSQSFHPAFDTRRWVDYPGDKPPIPPDEQVRGAFSWAFSHAYDRDDNPPPEPVRRRMIFRWRNREGGIDEAWYVGDTFADSFDTRRR